jgi:hypothetical protein
VVGATGPEYMVDREAANGALDTQWRFGLATARVMRPRYAHPYEQSVLRTSCIGGGRTGLGSR